MRREKISSHRWIETSFTEDLLSLRIQSHLAWQLYLARVAELRKNSGLGLIAPFVSVLVYVALLGSVMSLVFHEPTKTFIPFFAISFCLWQGISISISESANANERSAQYLSFPHISGFIVHYVNTLELFATMLLKVLAALLIILFVNYHILQHANYPGLLLGMALIVAVMFSWALPISYIFDQYRVLRGFLAQIIFAIYLVTPIFWSPARLSAHRWIVDLNPVFHLIEVTRAPLLDGHVPVLSLVITIALFASGLILSAALFRRNRDLIVYRWIA